MQGICIGFSIFIGIFIGIESIGFAFDEHVNLLLNGSFEFGFWSLDDRNITGERWTCAGGKGSIYTFEKGENQTGGRGMYQVISCENCDASNAVKIEQAGLRMVGGHIYWTTDYSYGECTGEIRDNYIYNNVGHEIFVKHNMPYPEKGGLNIYNNILCVDTGEYGGKTNTLEHNLYYREDGGNVWKWYFKSYISKTFNGTQIEAYREYSNQDQCHKVNDKVYNSCNVPAC